MGIIVQGKSFGVSNTYVMKKDVSVTGGIASQTGEEANNNTCASSAWNKGAYLIRSTATSGEIWTISIKTENVVFYEDIGFTRVASDKITDPSLFTIEDMLVAYTGAIAGSDGVVTQLRGASYVPYNVISSFLYYTTTLVDGVLTIHFNVNMSEYDAMKNILPNMNTVNPNGTPVMRDGFVLSRVFGKLKYNGKYIALTSTSAIYSNFELPTSERDVPEFGNVLGTTVYLPTYYIAETTDARSVGTLNVATFVSGDKLVDYSSSTKTLYFYFVFTPKRMYDKVELKETKSVGYLEYV